MLMIAPSMLAQNQTYIAALTSSPVPAQALVSPSILRRLKYCISQPRESHILSQTSPSTAKKLNVVNHFTYLGSTVSQSVTIDDEVNLRIARASATFGRLYENVWNRRGISIMTKLKVYRAVVLPT